MKGIMNSSTSVEVSSLGKFWGLGLISSESGKEDGKI